MPLSGLNRCWTTHRRTCMFRRKSSSYQELITFFAGEPQLASEVEHILAIAWALNTPFAPTEDGLTTHTQPSGQLRIANANALDEFGKQV